MAQWAAFISFFSKKRAVFLSLIVIEVLLYNLYISYPRITRQQLSHPVSNNHRCHNDRYPHTFYRKKIVSPNFSYYAYAIKIGEILSQSLTASEIDKYSHQISTDLLINQYAVTDPQLPVYALMQDIYHLYYNDFHHDSRIRCKWSTINDSVNLFEFIQIEAALQSSNESNLDFFNLLPQNNILSAHKYIAPKLFSYTISVNDTGDVTSLEFRFVEIQSVLQHNGAKHLLLNGLQETLLWCGEFYYIFDHFYNSYVVLLDDASGHFQPNISLIPNYLEYIMTKALFPYYNYTNTTYQPLRFIARKTVPWRNAKKRLFPVVTDIAQRNMMLNLLEAALNDGSTNENCHTLIAKTAQTMSIQDGLSLNTSLQIIQNKLKQLYIKCK